MVELLLNGKPVQFKIDTGVDIITISKEVVLETGWSQFKRKKKIPPWPSLASPTTFDVPIINDDLYEFDESSFLLS